MNLSGLFCVVGVIEQLQKEAADLKQQIKDLNDRNDGLATKVEALEKKAARQAAPFRIEDQKRVAHPKKPGRPRGIPAVAVPFRSTWMRKLLCRWRLVRTVAGKWDRAGKWCNILRSCRWCVRA